MSIALVLEEKDKLTLREIALPDEVGPDDVRIAIDTVGICGSDVHYYTHGKIGPFVVREPMVLGHEAAGVVTEVGGKVSRLSVGDRVCMEPGIPNMASKATKIGVYNVDPDVRFWATPPVHGCLTPSVVHPAAFTYRLPDHVSFAEGAMVEPFAIGMQAATRARIKPGDVALVTGAGPIGTMVALAALAGGCSKVYISDLVDEKLAVAAQYDNIHPVNAARDSASDVIAAATNGWGADVVFECAGAAQSVQAALEAVAPAGCVVWVGMPVDPVPVDIVLAQSKEIRMETVFRYANMYDRAIELLASGKVNLKPLISETFAFKDSIAAFDRAVEARPTDVKIQIKLGNGQAMALQRDTLADRILAELRPGLSADVLQQIDSLAAALTTARRIACYGVGREGLMMKALAMRLFHLGLDAHVVGDMTTPPVAAKDVLFISAGPGHFSTVEALIDVAYNAGAMVICVTAEPEGAVPAKADLVIHLPAQTMAADRGEAASSILPMGSLYEALMFLFFEILVLDLRDRMDIAPEAMRANHTNLE